MPQLWNSDEWPELIAGLHRLVPMTEVEECYLDAKITQRIVPRLRLRIACALYKNATTAEARLFWLLKILDYDEDTER